MPKGLPENALPLRDFRETRFWVAQGFRAAITALLSDRLQPWMPDPALNRCKTIFQLVHEFLRDAIQFQEVPFLQGQVFALHVVPNHSAKLVGGANAFQRQE